mmetsp:Transcript_43155/g.77363  ORF Transcript_43155/g.77363 Transcript_43155/m.77363 type:complete len:219 (-) Transcript_43155:14-670(-)
MHVLAGHSGPITSLNVVGDDSGAALAGSNGILRAATTDELILVSGSEDGTLKLWEKRRNGSLFVNRHTYYTPTEADSGGVCCTSVLHIPPARPLLSRLSAPVSLSRPTTNVQLDLPSTTPHPRWPLSRTPHSVTSGPLPLGRQNDGERDAATTSRLGRMSAMGRLQRGRLWRVSGFQGDSSDAPPEKETPGSDLLQSESQSTHSLKFDSSNAIAQSYV